MTIETGIENAGVYINTLDDTYPAGGDDLVEGDNHIRGIKNCLLNSFPAIAGAVTSTHTELNILDGVTSTTAELNILDGVTATTAELNRADLTAATGTVTAQEFLTTDASKDIGTFNNVTSTTFTGNLTGDVTGDVTGNSATATAFVASGTFNATGGDVTGSASSANGNYTVNLQIGAGTVNFSSEIAIGSGTASFGVVAAWTVPRGVYQIYISAATTTVELQVYVNPSWRTIRTLSPGDADQITGDNLRTRLFATTGTFQGNYEKLY